MLSNYWYTTIDYYFLKHVLFDQLHGLMLNSQQNWIDTETFVQQNDKVTVMEYPQFSKSVTISPNRYRPIHIEHVSGWRDSVNIIQDVMSTAQDYFHLKQWSSVHIVVWGRMIDVLGWVILAFSKIQLTRQIQCFSTNTSHGENRYLWFVLFCQSLSSLGWAISVWFPTKRRMLWPSRACFWRVTVVLMRMTTAWQCTLSRVSTTVCFMCWTRYVSVQCITYIIAVSFIAGEKWCTTLNSYIWVNNILTEQLHLCILHLYLRVFLLLLNYFLFFINLIHKVTAYLLILAILDIYRLSKTTVTKEHI